METNIPGKPVELLPGPILLDGLLQSFLLGTIVNQAFKYFIDSKNDSLNKRIFVTCVIVMCILQTMLEDYKAWRTLIWNRRWSTSRIEWSDLFLNGCICWLCEGFYIKRCWKMMGRSMWVLAPLSTLSILIMSANVYLAIAMGLAFRALEETKVDDPLTASHFLLPSTIVAFSVWIFGSLILETTVTILLLVSLWKSRTGLREVDKTVLRIIHLTWESAMLPTICMVIAVGLYHAAPRLDDHLVLFFVILTGKFYTFGMLRTLNTRTKLQKQMESGHGLGRTTISVGSWGTSSTASATQKSALIPEAKSMALKIFDGEERNVAGPSDPARSPIVFNSSQIITPVMESQERGTFRTMQLSPQQGPNSFTGKFRKSTGNRPHPQGIAHGASGDQTCV